jgi:hypothetical protein
MIGGQVSGHAQIFSSSRGGRVQLPSDAVDALTEKTEASTSALEKEGRGTKEAGRLDPFQGPAGCPVLAPCWFAPLCLGANGYWTFILFPV